MLCYRYDALNVLLTLQRSYYAYDYGSDPAGSDSENAVAMMNDICR